MNRRLPLLSWDLSGTLSSEIVHRTVTSQFIGGLECGGLFLTDDTIPSFANYVAANPTLERLSITTSSRNERGNVASVLFDKICGHRSVWWLEVTLLAKHDQDEPQLSQSLQSFLRGNKSVTKLVFRADQVRGAILEGLQEGLLDNTSITTVELGFPTRDEHVRVKAFIDRCTSDNRILQKLREPSSSFSADKWRLALNLLVGRSGEPRRLTVLYNFCRGHVGVLGSLANSTGRKRARSDAP